MSAASETDPDLIDFEQGERQSGESVLAWVRAEGVTAILTDRRLCLHSAGSAARCVSMTGPTLRYQPREEGDRLRAAFETDDGDLQFVVAGEEERAHLGNLLGNLAELREAQSKLQQAGLDLHYVSPPREGGDEGVSAVYQLIRLKEMLNQGLFSEIEFLRQRTVMIDRLCGEASSAAGP